MIHLYNSSLVSKPYLIHSTLKWILHIHFKVTDHNFSYFTFHLSLQTYTLVSFFFPIKFITRFNQAYSGVDKCYGSGHVYSVDAKRSQSRNYGYADVTFVMTTWVRLLRPERNRKGGQRKWLCESSQKEHCPWAYESTFFPNVMEISLANELYPWAIKCCQMWRGVVPRLN